MATGCRITADTVVVVVIDGTAVTETTAAIRLDVCC